MHKEIRFTTHIAASPERVWRAVESQAMIRRWLGAKTEFEPGLGGRVRVYDNTGEYVMGGEIVVWEPGRRMSFTWSQFAPTTHGATMLTFALEPETDGTRVTVLHDHFEHISEQDYLDYKQGWGTGESQLRRIAEIACEVSLARTFRAPRERVFRAWTEPAFLARWWGPKASAEVDLQVGGRFRLGMVLPNGVNLVAFGEYKEIAAPEKLVFTWNWEGYEAEPGPTLVGLDFTEQDGVTVVTVTHTGFISAAESGNHLQGWNDCIDRLERLLADAKDATA